MEHKILYLPGQKTISASHGQNLLEVLLQNSLIMDRVCAGNGTCGKCKIVVVEGNEEALTEEEKKVLTKQEIKAGYRLACQIKIQNDMIIRLSENIDGSDRKKNMNPLPESFLPDRNLLSYGIAIDIGTTTVVVMLWDLANGKMIDAEAVTNPQRQYGADVISRIQFCMEDSKYVEKMQSLVIDSINGMIRQLCMRNHVLQKQITSATMVGNTTMSHLFVGIDPSSLAKAPFTPVFCEGMHKNAEELGLYMNEDADVYILPNIAGHVGSDITGVVLASELPILTGNTIVIDIGTNGEIVAASNGEMKTCSTAAGPAFEGACIQCGMRAAKGAIEHVLLEEDVILEIIDADIPLGICGSGLIDVVSELVRHGLINKRGNLISEKEALEKGVSPNIAKRLYGNRKEAGFLLYDFALEEKEPIVLTQKDIREVQLAKGAILAGMKTLMKKINCTEKTLDRVIIAGAFGNHIRKESAICMGLLPEIDAEKVITIGNGAGTGAAMALLSEKVRQNAEAYRKEIIHIELSKDVDFQKYYARCMLFNS